MFEVASNVRFGSLADINASTEKGPLSGVKADIRRVGPERPLLAKSRHSNVREESEILRILGVSNPP